MLNPSTADEVSNDATIVRCVRRARELGFGRLMVTNLFAFRTTSPRLLWSEVDPVGTENDGTLLDVASASDLVVCAWGAHGTLRGRALSVTRALRDAGLALHALRLTAKGEPVHPLYVPYAMRPALWLPAVSLGAGAP